MSQYAHALFWFRRDLRLTDNSGLYQALQRSQRVSCVFVFEREILDALPSQEDRRVEFIRESLVELQRILRRHGSALTVLHGHPVEEIPALAARVKASAVFANHDYEPGAVRRDRAIGAALTKAGIDFITCKDQVIFERHEVLTQSGQPFSVFTPYKNAWLKCLTPEDLQRYPSEKLLDRLAPMAAAEVPSLESIGFKPTNLKSLGITAGHTGAAKLFDDFLQRIEHYHETRNFPAVKGPSYLSVHLRFGTISIRTLARAAWERGGYGAQTWLNELIWRDFYFMILHHHPRVVSEAFRPAFNEVKFTNDSARFEAWCEARTGYPLVH